MTIPAAATDQRDRLRARAREIAEQAPPLSVAQQDRLRQLLTVPAPVGVTPRPREPPE